MLRLVKKAEEVWGKKRRGSPIGQPKMQQALPLVNWLYPTSFAAAVCEISSHAAVDVRAVEDRDGVPVAEAVARVAHVEEGLVVVGGELGQPRHQLLHLTHPHLKKG